MGVEFLSLDVNDLKLASFLSLNELSKIHLKTSLSVEVVLDEALDRLSGNCLLSISGTLVDDLLNLIGVKILDRELIRKDLQVGTMRWGVTLMGQWRI